MQAGGGEASHWLVKLKSLFPLTEVHYALEDYCNKFNLVSCHPGVAQGEVRVICHRKHNRHIDVIFG